MTQEEWDLFIAYVAGFYANKGNYHSCGSQKIVPEIPIDKFKHILTSSPNYLNASDTLFKEYFDNLWPLVERELYILDKPFAQLGFPEQGGVTVYFSPSMSEGDLALI